MIEDNGVIAVWKPKKTKSSEIVRNIKSQYGFKTGHAGTLDPFAEGVLIVCTGQKTKTVK